MKTSMIVLIIVACSCIVAGLVLLCVSFFMSNGDLSIFTAASYVDNEYIFEEDFDTIEITDDMAKIELLPAEDGKCRIVLFERERMTHTASIADGKLSIKVKDERKVFDYIGIFNVKTPSVKVYLPKSEYSSLSVSTHTGRITLPDSLSFGSATLSVTTGFTSVRSNISGALSISATTGDVHIESVSLSSLNVSTSTGDLRLKSVDATQNLNISTTTGDIDMSNVNCKNLSVKVSTGEISMRSVIASEQIKVDSTTGDVELERCDAATLKMTTTTGDVEGTLLSDKIFYANSDTGKVRVPSSDSGGKCEVKCDTGDIILKIVE